jgi:broad specificity phosphatase PhoE
MEQEKILFSRHLDEIDDLETYGRDAPLIDTPENREKLEKISKALYEKLLESKKEAVLFVTSPRIRAQQTAKLVADKITEMSGGAIKVRFSANENLKATEQGDFILPEDYKANDVFVGLKLANKIFNKETHGSDEPGGVDNIDYRFGDPVKTGEGEYKYPELVPYFSEYGETYKDSLIRLYGAVLDTSKKYEKFLGNTEVVIVAHGQIYHVFRGLVELSKMIKRGDVEYKKGDSAKLLWEIYKNCSDDQKVTGICMPLDLEILTDQDMLALLREEIDYLKNS